MNYRLNARSFEKIKENQEKLMNNQKTLFTKYLGHGTIISATGEVLGSPPFSLLEPDSLSYHAW
jgi:hypothetical protein